MELKNICLEVDEGIGIVTINRPQVRNALDRQTVRELADVINFVEHNDKIKVVIFTGAGEKAFVAGADVAALLERTVLETYFNENQAILSQLAAMKKVTIAAVNGVALGGGCELALACDLRIASDNAKLGQPELTLGILPGAGGTQRLSRLIGVAKAKELILTGDIIDAAEALRIGLVNKVVPLGEAVQSAIEMARKILLKGPTAVCIAKEVINLGINTDLNSGLFIERLAQTVLFSTEDRHEGLSAFLEKRPPKFKGK